MRDAESSTFWRASTRSRAWLCCEFFVLYVAMPFGLWALRKSAGPLIPVIMIASGVFFYRALKRDPDFPRRRLWNRRGARLAGRSIVRHFIPGAALVCGAVLWWTPEEFLAFPRQRTGLWLLIMVAYPCVSVYPQELIFRTFFFHRYHRLLPSRRAKIIASALAFGLAHILFGNLLAPLLSTGGGLIFAATYVRGRSTLGCALEHALWGQFLFTVGLGRYFYGGAI